MAFRNLDRITERLRQARVAQLEPLRRALASTDAAAAPDGFIAGARVFDRVSGQEGIVLGRTSENVIVPAPRRTDGGDSVRATPERDDRPAST